LCRSQQGGDEATKEAICDADIEFLGCFFTAASVPSQQGSGREKDGFINQSQVSTIGIHWFLQVTFNEFWTFFEALVCFSFEASFDLEMLRPR